MEVADMGVAFDYHGKVMRVKQLDPSKFTVPNEAQDIITSDMREEMTQVVESEVMKKLRKIQEDKKKGKIIDNQIESV